jgi:hypothetical protein
MTKLFKKFEDMPRKSKDDIPSVGTYIRKLESRIQELESQLKQVRTQLSEAESVIQFYSDKKNWKGLTLSYLSSITADDMGALQLNENAYITNSLGGLRARQYIEKNSIKDNT